MKVFQLTLQLFKVFKGIEKKIFFILFLFQIILSCLELISFGALIPLFKSFTDPAWVIDRFNFLNIKIQIEDIFIFIIFIFFIKNLFLVFITYFDIKFRNKVTLRILNDIYGGYLRKKYQFHIDNNSAILLRNVQQESYKGIGSIESNLATLLFEEGVDFNVLIDKMNNGAKVKSTNLTPNYTLEDFFIAETLYNAINK